MAGNEECTIAIIDVRRTANEELKLKAIKCVADILKEKISTQKKDYVSFVLLGTARTFNDVNSTLMNDGYLNIVQYPQVQIPSWQLLIDFYKFVNEEASDNGDWLDALVVSMEILKNSKDTLNYHRHRILLFHDFNGQLNNYDMYDVIAENIAKVEIDVFVISQSIRYVDNPASGPQAMFVGLHKSDHQLENEKYALRLGTDCNARLCNFNEALHFILVAGNKRPTVWNTTLRIGTKLKIQISGFITIKDENHIKHKKCWGAPGVTASRVKQFFVCENEVEPLPDDLIEGYMLGATAIPYDESLRNVQREPGIKFLGFTKRNLILDEYFSGNALYCIVHQNGQEASARKLDALVRALITADMAILCWKIYSVRFNNPKLVVLLPNKLDEPASMSMIELAHHDQHQFWNFPSLRTERATCSQEQIACIDKLIDAMDLTGEALDSSKNPRDTCDKDLMPYDNFPHIYEHNVMDVLERKVLSNASEDDVQFQKMLEDNNFVDIFWKLPEPIEQNTKNAANHVKGQFPLEKITASTPRDTAKENIQSNNNVCKTELPCVACIGLETPSNDFEQLLQVKVISLLDNTERDAQYNLYAAQMRAAIWKLIFETGHLELEMKKLSKSLSVYRKSCFEFNAIDEFNKWIREVKSSVMAKGLHAFWKAVIVQDKLGLCVFGEPSLEDILAFNDFYSLGRADSSQFPLQNNDEMNDSSIDELLANI